MDSVNRQADNILKIKNFEELCKSAHNGDAEDMEFISMLLESCKESDKERYWYFMYILEKTARELGI